MDALSEVPEWRHSGRSHGGEAPCPPRSVPVGRADDAQATPLTGERPEETRAWEERPTGASPRARCAAPLPLLTPEQHLLQTAVLPPNGTRHACHQGAPTPPISVPKPSAMMDDAGRTFGRRDGLPRILVLHGHTRCSPSHGGTRPSHSALLVRHAFRPFRLPDSHSRHAGAVARTMLRCRCCARNRRTISIGVVVGDVLILAGAAERLANMACRPEAPDLGSSPLAFCLAG